MPTPRVWGLPWSPSSHQRDLQSAVQVRRAAPVYRCAPSCWGTVAGTEDQTRTAGPARPRAAESLLCSFMIDRSRLPWMAVFFSSAFRMRLEAGTAFALSQLCVGPPIFRPSRLWSLQQGRWGEGCGGSHGASRQGIPSPSQLTAQAAFLRRQQRRGFPHVFLRANCTGSLPAGPGRDASHGSHYPPAQRPGKTSQAASASKHPQPDTGPHQNHLMQIYASFHLQRSSKARIWMVFCVRCPRVPQGPRAGHNPS